MVKIFPSSHGWIEEAPEEQSIKVPVHGTQMLPVRSKIVWTSFIVQGLLSSQLTIEVVPLEQSTGVPEQGMQVEPSQSKVVF